MIFLPALRIQNFSNEDYPKLGLQDEQFEHYLKDEPRNETEKSQPSYSNHVFTMRTAVYDVVAVIGKSKIENGIVRLEQQVCAFSNANDFTLRCQMHRVATYMQNNNWFQKICVALEQNQWLRSYTTAVENGAIVHNIRV